MQAREQGRERDPGTGRGSLTSVVVVAADLSGARAPDGAGAAEARLREILGTAFGSAGSAVVRLGPGHFAVVVDPRGGRRARVDTLPGVLGAAMDGVPVSLWIEEVPAGRSAELIRRLSAVSAGAVTALPHRTADGETRGTDRRSRPPRFAVAVAAVAASLSVLLGLGSMVAAGDSPGSTHAASGAGGTGQEHPAAPGSAVDVAGATTSPEAATGDGVATTGPTGTGVTDPSVGVADPGRHGELAVTVVAVGVGGAEAVSLLPEGLVARRIVEGVPVPGDLPSVESVAVVLRGETPAELCVVLELVTVVASVGDPVDCGAAVDEPESPPGDGGSAGGVAGSADAQAAEGLGFFGSS